MPTDVRTQWNSTYDLLEFAIKYTKAVDKLTSERTLKLRKYEVDPGEWILAGQLCDVLKVFHMLAALSPIANFVMAPGFQGCNQLFLEESHIEYHSSDPSNGSLRSSTYFNHGIR